MVAMLVYDITMWRLKHAYIYISLRSLPNISGEEFDLIFDELDDSRDFKVFYIIVWKEYIVANLLN